MSLFFESDKLEQLLNGLFDFLFGNSFEGGKEIEMLIGSEFLPENIELSAQAYEFSNLVDLVDAVPVDDDLSLLALIWW